MVKVELKNAIFLSMKKSKEARDKDDGASPTLKFGNKLESEHLQKRQVAFNKSLEEETKQMSRIADSILSQKEYMRKFKQIEKYVD